MFDFMFIAIVCGGIFIECVFGKFLHNYFVNKNIQGILKKW